MRGQEDHEKSSLSESDCRAGMSTGLFDGEQYRAGKELDIGICIVLRDTDVLVVWQIRTKVRPELRYSKTLSYNK